MATNKPNDNTKKNFRSRIELRAMEVLKDVIRNATTKAELEDLIAKYKAVSAGDIDVACEVYDRYVLNNEFAADVVDEQNSADEAQDDDADEQNVADENVEAQPETDNADQQIVDVQYETTQTANIGAKNEETADVINSYLDEEFVAQQMQGYGDTVWEDCDADYLDMHNGTYEHVFYDANAVKFADMTEYKKHLNAYRSKENEAVQNYEKAFKSISDNKKSRLGALGALGKDKAKKLYKLGAVLIVVGMIVGLIAGIVGSTACLDGDLARAINSYGTDLADASSHMKSARALFITCAVMASLLGVGGIAVIFGARGSVPVDKTIKVTVKDPVSKQKKILQLQGQAYDKTLKMGAFVCAIVLIFLIIASSLVISARVDYDNYGEEYISYDGFNFVTRNANDVNYYGTKKVAYITGYESNYYQNLTIPQCIYKDRVKYDVVGINSLDCSKITGLTIGENVRSIENGALKGNAIEKLTIKNNTNMAKLGDIFSSGCYAKNIDYTCVYSNLISVKFFSQMSKTESITIRNATSVATNAFYGCDSLRTLDLGDCGVGLLMQRGSLNGCSNLARLTLSGMNVGYEYATNKSYLAIMYDATTLPTSLTYFTVTKATHIPAYAFYGCANIKTITCKNATSVGSYAFAYCSQLETIYMPQKGIDYINSRAAASILDGSSKAVLRAY